MQVLPVPPQALGACRVRDLRRVDVVIPVRLVVCQVRCRRLVRLADRLSRQLQSIALAPLHVPLPIVLAPKNIMVLVDNLLLGLPAYVIDYTPDEPGPIVSISLPILNPPSASHPTTLPINTVVVGLSTILAVPCASASLYVTPSISSWMVLPPASTSTSLGWCARLCACAPSSA